MPIILLKPALAVLALGGLMAVLQVGGAPWVDALRFDRAEILEGEVWRVFSGHLVHLGWTHLALNLAALAILALLVEPRSVRAAAAAVGALMLGTSLGLLLASPDVVGYVGFSGILHGLVVLAAAGLLRPSGGLPQKWAGALVLASVAAKVLWEQIAGAEPALAEAIGGMVIVDAHLYGALSGVAIAALAMAWQHQRAARK